MKRWEQMNKSMNDIQDSVTEALQVNEAYKAGEINSIQWSFKIGTIAYRINGIIGSLCYTEYNSGDNPGTPSTINTAL